MNGPARVAFVIAQAACANAEIAGMQAANQQCIAAGIPLIYGEDAFQGISYRFLIGHNAVIEYLRDYE